MLMYTGALARLTLHLFMYCVKAATVALKTFDLLQAFAQFAHPAGAQAAKDAIHGRLFAGSTVEVGYITMQQFAAVGGFQ